MINNEEGIKHTSNVDIEVVNNEGKTTEELQAISKAYNEEQEMLFFKKHNNKKEGE